MLTIFRPDTDPFRERMDSIRNRLFEWSAITHSSGYRSTSERVFGDVPEPDEAVRRIVRQVREQGDKALLEYTEAFDGAALDPDRIEVSAPEIRQACIEVPDSFTAACDRAAQRVSDFQKKILENQADPKQEEIYLRRIPVERVGIYIPGGTGGSTPLVSSVYMNAVPAREAGVDEIYVCTPPGSEGDISPYILAACTACGVDRIFRAGGAQAVAAMAYGTQTVPRADMIAGPGNLFVMLAKKEVFGQAGIDLLAGPSEICIIADENADTVCIAADLLSQAEHDPLSSCILITDDEECAENVRTCISEQIESLSRRDIIEPAFDSYGGIVIAGSLEEAAEIANMIAPEHLEIMTDDPSNLLPLIRNAGTVFLGRFSPEACGDYMAGPSHTLPTGGTARFFSGLSADTFMKKSAVINISEASFSSISADTMSIAEIEGLDAHTNSISVRRSDEE